MFLGELIHFDGVIVVVLGIGDYFVYYVVSHKLGYFGSVFLKLWFAGGNTWCLYLVGIVGDSKFLRGGAALYIQVLGPTKINQAHLL